MLGEIWKCCMMGVIYRNELWASKKGQPKQTV